MAFSVLTMAISLKLPAASGLAALGVRYVFARPPLDYHARILGEAGEPVVVRRLLGARHRTMGAAFVGLALAVAFLSVFGTGANLLWAKLAILLSALVVGLPAMMMGRIAEQVTGVRTPWRISALLLAMVLLAFVLSKAG